MSSASVQALSHGEAQRKSSTRRKVLHKTRMHAISFPLRWRKEKREKKNIEWRYTIGVVIKPLDTSAAIATGSRWALNDRKRIYTSNTYTHVHTGHQLSPGRQQILVYIHIKNEESSVVCIIRHEIGESSLRNFFSHLTRPAIAHFRFIFQQCQAKHVHTPKTKIKKENFFQMKCREFICWMFLSSHFICM